MSSYLCFIRDKEHNFVCTLIHRCVLKCFVKLLLSYIPEFCEKSNIEILAVQTSNIKLKVILQFIEYDIRPDTKDTLQINRLRGRENFAF